MSWRMKLPAGNLDAERLKTKPGGQFVCMTMLHSGDLPRVVLLGD